MTTEALLHSFLTSSESLPGATPPAWLAGQQQLELGALRGLDSAAAESTGDDFGTVFVGDGVMAPDALAATAAGHMGGHLGGSAAGAAADGSSGLGMSGSGQARFATQAAFRRAADLLQACGAARRRQQLGYAGDGAYEGALGLTRKLHYTGYVQGLMNGRGSAAAAAAMGHAGSSAIAAGGSGAAAVVRQHGTPSLHNLRGVDEEHEAAGNGSALAAEASRSSVSSIDSEASVQSEMAVAEEVRICVWPGRLHMLPCCCVPAILAALLGSCRGVVKGNWLCSTLLRMLEALVHARQPHADLAACTSQRLNTACMHMLLPRRGNRNCAAIYDMCFADRVVPFVYKTYRSPRGSKSRCSSPAPVQHTWQ